MKKINSYSAPEEHNQRKAAVAFNKQSLIFDDLYADNAIIEYKRARVRNHVLSRISPGSHILEINSGTGEDAIFFARRGFPVHATDLSTGMLQVLRRKIGEFKLESIISSECCSYTDLSLLKDKGPFDLIFSNFAGLNCTGELNKVLEQFDKLLKPGGIATLVILPRFCLWETLLLFKGKFKTAFRRFFSSKGRKAHIEGEYFRCWYYSPNDVRRGLTETFDLLSLEGLCTLVPPSYIQYFPQNHPSSFSFLKKLEDRWKSKWPWKYIGDYYIISFKKKGNRS